MKYGITFFLVLIFTCAMAQNYSEVSAAYFFAQFSPVHTESFQKKSLSPRLLIPDEQLMHRLKSPLLTAWASSARIKGENYWLGSVTTQSYNRGKLGTYYLWDVQGNLRESRTFVDIAGKNKRGLKLVFRRR